MHLAPAFHISGMRLSKCCILLSTCIADSWCVTLPGTVSCAWQCPCPGAPADLGHVQGVVAVRLSDIDGNVVSDSLVKGSIVRGKKGQVWELQFTAKAPGQYEAVLPPADMQLGTHQ